MSEASTLSGEAAIKQVGRYLSLGFGGYFMCRLATDPDPSDDPYGTSGYTMALSHEPVLDRVIRLQYDHRASPLRPNPLPKLCEQVREGVTVKSVRFDGVADPERTKTLLGARVDLLGNPKFNSTNNTVGSDDTLAFVVEPFHLKITHDALHDGQRVALVIEAEDNLIPGNPKVTAVEIPDPALYATRLSTFGPNPSPAVNQAIGVFDEYGYFRDRLRWLKEQISSDRTSSEEKQSYRSRVFQLEAWGDRVINKLGFQAIWSHGTNGLQKFETVPLEMSSKLLDGCVIKDQPWTVNYWFGGWDGDLLVGYMAGALNIPFVPA
jgi:hypothetical protein